MYEVTNRQGEPVNQLVARPTQRGERRWRRRRRSPHFYRPPSMQASQSRKCA